MATDTTIPITLTVPFDYDKVKEGWKVVTREGKPVTQLTKFETTDRYCLIGTVDKTIEKWQPDGSFEGCLESNYDLRLVPPVEYKYIILDKAKLNVRLPINDFKTIALRDELIQIRITYSAGEPIKAELV